MSEVRHADEEDAEASCEEGEADEVELLELLPSRFLKIMLRARGWEIADECAGDTDHGVDDGDVEAPPPGRLDEELGCEVHAEAAPGNVDAEFGPAKTNASAGCQDWYRNCYIRPTYRYLLGSSSEIPGYPTKMVPAPNPLLLVRKSSKDIGKSTS